MPRYDSGFFTNQSIPTIGIEYINKKINIEGRNYRVKIWDTAGQERYKSLTQNFYRNADGVVLVYDLTDKDSFDKIRGWIQSVHENSKDVKLILIGNKLDLIDKRKVSRESGEKLASYHNIPFFETSAKDTRGVNDAFDKLISDVVSEIKEKRSSSKIELVNTKPYYSCCSY